MVSFRFHTFVDEEVELANFVDGDLSNERTLTPTPLPQRTSSLEGE